MPTRMQGIVAACVVGVLAVAATVLPDGIPVGVVVHGLVLGSLTALTAMGLVLVYRASRIINFAQAEIGGIAASVAVVLVAGSRLPYLLAVTVGLVVAIATGLLIDATVVRRFFRAPRLIFTVATIGLAQLLGAGQIALPRLYGDLGPLSDFGVPLSVSFRIGPLVFGGDHVVAIVVVPAVLVGLSLFFSRTDVGIAVRAAADSEDRALLLGIPVRRLSRITWVLAASLSGLGAILTAPILGPSIGAVAGPTALLSPIAAAVIGRMSNLPRTVAAALAIGVFEQVVLWNFPRSATVDVALLVVVLAALLLQRRQYQRVSDTGLGGFTEDAEARPLPAEVRRLPSVRALRWTGVLVIVLVAVVLPVTWSDAVLTSAAYIAIFGILALSMVVLTGWSGQLSLGQFAFAGVGAGVAAGLLVHAQQDLFVALLAATAAGSLTAIVVGIPAVRIPGPFLAVTTLAFGIPVSTWLLNAANFPWLTPPRLVRPVLLDRFDLESRLAFYFFCLLVLAGCVRLVVNYRRSRAGRAVLAVRDNERAATSYGLDPTRVRLTAFAISGGLAGLAGSLYVVGLQGMPFSGFDPVNSFVVFTMVVIGGASSVGGVLAGAAYVQVAQSFLSGAAQLLATGAGLLLLLFVAPGGLAAVGRSIRDAVVGRLAEHAGLTLGAPAQPSEPLAGQDVAAPLEAVDTGGAPVGDRHLLVDGIDAGYGRLQVLAEVDLDAQDGEMVALLGTNGAGKSTVLRVVSGLLRPTAGRVVVRGVDITDLDAAQRVEAGIVLVPGGRGIFPSLTVEENLRLGGWLRRDDPAFVDAARRRIFDLFPVLEERLGSPASQLSGGEQQMLTLAQALLCDPTLLMIDELSLGLAPAIVGELLDVVRQINASGTTVVVVEQSLNVAAALAERAVFMEKGQVRFTGPTADLAERTDLARSVFLPESPSAREPRDDLAALHQPDDADQVRLAVHGLSRSFGGVVAVRDVDLEVLGGQIVGLIGANGAGKTTLFDLMSGFLDPTAGRIELLGRDVTDLPAARRAMLGLGRTFQDARLFPSLTVRETIATAAERHVMARDPVASMLRVHAVQASEAATFEVVDALIDLLRLGPYHQAFVSELSTGTRRIVELACALAQQPAVLLLDEPAAGVAQREVEALTEMLFDVRDLLGTSMVLIEHDIPLVSSVADEVVCLHLGQVLSRGSAREVLDDPQVVASYLGDTDVAIARSGKASV